MRTVKLAPSILTADFGRLADEVRSAEEGGADLLHLDVMDGRFVPVITFGPLVVEALRKVTKLPFEVHLMTMEPEKQVAAFAELATMVNVHVEVSPHLQHTVDTIHKLGAKAGVCLNPSTPVSAVEDTLPDLDQVMVMLINPGWGGQQMMPRLLDKVRTLRRMVEANRYRAEIEVDGGVKIHNVVDCVSAGADTLVCGSAVFNGERSPADNLAALRVAVHKA